MSPTESTPELNVLGEPLEVAATDPVTGFYRDGTCRCADDPGLHAICAVMTDEFLAHQVATGNDLVTPQPRWGFPGLRAGDRWCVVAARWLHAHHDRIAPPVVLAATSQRALEVVPLEVLRSYAVDVPPDLSSLG